MGAPPDLSQFAARIRAILASPEAIQAAAALLRARGLLNNAGYLDGDEERAAEAVLEALDPLVVAAVTAEAGAHANACPSRFADANRERARRAARRDVQVAARALETAPHPDWPLWWGAIAQARVDLPDATLAEVGARIGVSKHSAAAAMRRLRAAMEVTEANGDAAAAVRPATGRGATC